MPSQLEISNAYPRRSPFSSLLHYQCALKLNIRALNEMKHYYSNQERANLLTLAINQVYEGEKDNNLLSKFEQKDIIPPAPRGVPQINLFEN
ncbi:hypothetical protein K7X08_016819 [Anisodus acutangulus]|uniref:Uncharacterized protein n=1 Tax=Anisodus acutangulus TaxID=402998 RepID=A0A9Q1R5S3_9SOLA|nr:hypothetical protein K7X08_016819 [Anisodus acutangulus]